MILGPDWTHEKLNKKLALGNSYPAVGEKDIEIFLTLKSCVESMPDDRILNAVVVQVKTGGDIMDELVVDANNNITGTRYYAEKVIPALPVSKFDILRFLNNGEYNTGAHNTGNYNTGSGNAGNNNSGTENKGSYNSGNFNSGNHNSGDYNEGSYNAGSNNTGSYNSGKANNGDHNSGINNKGSHNYGNCNAGNKNAGSCNRGDDNIGSLNIGFRNISNANVGDDNVGGRNKGSRNAGIYNIGDDNSGSYNLGNNNCGDYNSTDNSNGAFNTKEPEIWLFDKPSGITLSQFRASPGYKILAGYFDGPRADKDNIRTDICECKYDDLDSNERSALPDAAFTGRCPVERVYTNESNQDIWDALSRENKDKILALPNFDAEIFEKILGVDISKKPKRAKNTRAPKPAAKAAGTRKKSSRKGAGT